MTKYFIKNKALPHAIQKLHRLERLLTKARIDDAIEGFTSTLQKSLIKRIALQKELIDKLQCKYDELEAERLAKKDATNWQRKLDMLKTTC